MKRKQKALAGLGRQPTSLQQRMTAMLLIFVLQSMAFTGVIVLIGNTYLQRFNEIMNDCYSINRLLSAYTAEAEQYRRYVLYGEESAYSQYLALRAQSNQSLQAVSLPYDESHEQHLLLQAITTTFASFRTACDETVFKHLAGNPYAEAYDRSLSIGQYIEGYIRSLLQLAIGEGQEIYQRNMVQFRILPLLFGISIVFSFLCVVLWARWMVKRVVTPINDLIRVTGDMGEYHYDAPDVVIYEEDEIAQLARVVNTTKHATAQLLDSLHAKQEIESRLHEEEMQRVRLEAAMDTLRLSLLQSQINPHFLFNTLNIISRMAQAESAPVTEELIVRLANLFRYNLQSMDEIVPLENELRIVQDYIAIQRIRFGERILFALDCQAEVKRHTLPVFTMQPLIENAVIHGISPKEEGGSITVEIMEQDAFLMITVRDTGVGMSTEQVQALLHSDVATRPHVSGLGLGSVRSRIVGHCPGSRFEIDSVQDEGTCIRIAIPLCAGGEEHV